MAKSFPQWNNLSREQKQELGSTIGDLVVSDINSFLDESKSPVSGGSFKKKKADGTTSRLFEDGDLRASITFDHNGLNVIEVGVFDQSEAPKAFNHNTGDTLPVRKFIPGEDEKFKLKINAKIKETINREANNRTTLGDVLDG